MYIVNNQHSLTCLFWWNKGCNQNGVTFMLVSEPLFLPFQVIIEVLITDICN